MRFNLNKCQSRDFSTLFIQGARFVLVVVGITNFNIMSSNYEQSFYSAPSLNGPRLAGQF